MEYLEKKVYVMTLLATNAIVRTINEVTQRIVIILCFNIDSNKGRYKLSLIYFIPASSFKRTLPYRDFPLIGLSTLAFAKCPGKTKIALYQRKDQTDDNDITHIVYHLHMTFDKE